MTTHTSPMNSDPVPPDVDVAVVGAGPVGLAMARALAHHGATCAVLDRETELSSTSRANNLWSRTQELLAVGARETLTAEAHRVTSIQVLQDGRPLDTVPLDNVPSPHGPALYSSQAIIEERLAERDAEPEETR